MFCNNEYPVDFMNYSVYLITWVVLVVWFGIYDFGVFFRVKIWKHNYPRNLWNVSTSMLGILTLHRNSSELFRSFSKNTELLAIRIILWARTSNFSGPTKKETSQLIWLDNIWCIHSTNDLSPCQSSCSFKFGLTFVSDWMKSLLLLSSVSAVTEPTPLLVLILKGEHYLKFNLSLLIYNILSRTYALLSRTNDILIAISYT